MIEHPACFPDLADFFLVPSSHGDLERDRRFVEFKEIRVASVTAAAIPNTVHDFPTLSSGRYWKKCVVFGVRGLLWRPIKLRISNVCLYLKRSPNFLYTRAAACNIQSNSDD